MALGQLDINTKKQTKTLIYVSCCIPNLKWIRKLNMKCKIIEVLEKDKRKFL